MTKIKRSFGFGSILISAILACSTALVFGQTSESKVKPTGSISGRVTSGEKPAPGILVIATNQNSQTQIGQGKSDAEGNYRIFGLSAGTVSLTPVAPVYVPTNQVFGQGRMVNLAANEAVEGIADEQYVRNVVDVLYRTDVKRERAAPATAETAKEGRQDAGGTLIA